MTKTTRPYATWSRITFLGLALFGCAVSAPVLAAGDCSTASIGEPFLLPDGRAFAAGDLSLCLERQESPVAALHEARVDGMPVGLYYSHVGPAGEELLEQPYLVFGRAPDGRLHLRGLVQPGRDGGTLNAFGDPRVRIRVEIGDFFVHTASGPGADPTVWIATRRG